MAPEQPTMVPFTPTFSLYILLAVAGGIYLDSIRRWKKRRCGLSLPPGPPRWPLIGNWFDMPQYKPWVQFKKMRLTYGTHHLYIISQSRSKALFKVMSSTSKFSTKVSSSSEVLSWR